MSWVHAYPHDVKSVGSWACTASFCPFVGLDIVLAEAPARPARWASIFVAPFLAMLAHWICYLFPWALMTHLLYFYLLLCPWACWLSFLPHWHIGFITPFLGVPRPIYFTFTTYCVHGPTGCHSCHVGPLSLLLLYLDFHDPFILLLPLIMPMSLLVVIPVMLAYWVYHLFFWISKTHLLYFYLFYFHFSLTFSYCWASSVIVLFVKNMHQQKNS